MGLRNELKIHFHNAECRLILFGTVRTRIEIIYVTILPLRLYYLVSECAASHNNEVFVLLGLVSLSLYFLYVAAVCSSSRCFGCLFNIFSFKFNFQRVI